MVAWVLTESDQPSSLCGTIEENDMSENRKGPGKPLKLSEDQIQLLAELAYECTPVTEIAILMDIDRKALYETETYRKIIDYQRARRQLALRSKQLAMAEAGSVPMLKLLGRELLGQSTTPPVSTTELNNAMDNVHKLENNHLIEAEELIDAKWQARLKSVN